MAPIRESNGRVERRVQLTQYEGETYEDYIKRRKRNNEAVKRSREKAKTKIKDTLDSVNTLKMENCTLEAQIRMYQEQFTDLRGIFVENEADGRVIAEIDALLDETNIDAKQPNTTKITTQEKIIY